MELESVLPEDLLSEILPHLPLKSLGQCKVLSSRWNTEISHRCLITTHPERHPEPDSTLLLPSERNSSLIILPRHNGDVDSICRTMSKSLSCDLTNPRVVVGTHHGLICFSHCKTGDARVWNPVLKQWRTLDFRLRSYNHHSNIVFGFGFDAIKNDYKVVRIVNSVIIEIWELRDTQTRVILLPPAQVQFMLTKATPITVNGSSHWIAFHPQNKNLQIVRFDMDREKFVEIPFSNDMPNISYDVRVRGTKWLNLGELALQGLEVDGKIFRLGVFKGSLCLFISDSLIVEIWLMNCEDGHVVWTRIFEIPISRRIADVVGFTANEELAVRNKNNGYFAYDPWKKRYILPLGYYGLNLIHQVVAYAQSTVPVSPR